MVAGPEIARMVEEFEDCTLEERRGDINHRYYEQHLGVQAAFMKDVRLLTEVFKEMGNPILRKPRPRGT